MADFVEKETGGARKRSKERGTRGKWLTRRTEGAGNRSEEYDSRERRKQGEKEGSRGRTAIAGSGVDTQSSKDAVASAALTSF